MSEQLTLEAFVADVWRPGQTCPHCGHSHACIEHVEICGLQKSGWRWKTLRRAEKADTTASHKADNGRYRHVDGGRFNELVPPSEHDWPL